LSTIIAAAGAIPFLFGVDISWVFTVRGVLVVGWLGIVTIGVAYQLISAGVGGLPAATASTLALAEPATATILGLLVLHEALTLPGVLGLICLAIGLVAIARSTTK
jgi:DME family drug/metabolite transporter